MIKKNGKTLLQSRSVTAAYETWSEAAMSAIGTSDFWELERYAQCLGKQIHSPTPLWNRQENVYFSEITSDRYQ